mgnify:CR=1 FL=1
MCIRDSKSDARPFKVSKDIKMMVVNSKTGKKAEYGSDNNIIEAFKTENLDKNSFEQNENLNYKLNINYIFNFY